jgi:hypothetical protein
MYVPKKIQINENNFTQIVKIFLVFSLVFTP